MLMRQRIGSCLLFFAWLCCQGLFLDVAQFVAWGTMFAGNVKQMSVPEAIEATFDPDLPCNLCLTIKEARASHGGEDNPNVPTLPRQPAPETPPLSPLSLPPPMIALKVPDGISPEWYRPDNRSADPLSAKVPVPPPRQLI